MQAAPTTNKSPAEGPGQPDTPPAESLAITHIQTLDGTVVVVETPVGKRLNLHEHHGVWEFDMCSYYLMDAKTGEFYRPYANKFFVPTENVDNEPHVLIATILDTDTTEQLKHFFAESLQRLKSGLSIQTITNREVALAAVTQNGWALRRAPSFQADKEIVLAAVNQDGLILQGVTSSLKKDKKVVLAAVTENGYALKYVDPSFQADMDVVLAAVTRSMWVLKLVHPSLKANREVTLAAVTQNGLALKFADPSLQADKKVVLAAVTQDRCALKYASPSLQADKEVVLATVTAITTNRTWDCEKMRSWILRFVDRSLQADSDVLRAAGLCSSAKRRRTC